MRDYIIINGVNSLTIKGLAIQKLPTITKPMKRTIREEIDGRNGDIVTELGYSAYDKTMTIGLFGDYDINEVIAFFNQKGSITFSDEADKYYNFEILEQIDFEKLVKFRTATITLHCQPFKYPINEEPQEIEFQYVNGSGKDISLDNTSSQPMQVELEGELEQVTYTGQQLLDYLAFSSQQYISINGNNITINNTSGATIYPTINYSNLEAGAYTLFVKKIELTAPSGTPIIYVQENTSDYSTTHSIVQQINASTTTAVQTKTFSDTIKRIMIAVATGTKLTLEIMFVKGTYTSQTMPPYEPYVGGVPAPSPSYPQSIDVVEGYNLFDKDNVRVGISWNLTSNTARAIYQAKVKPNTTYYLQIENIEGFNAVYFYGKTNDTDTTASIGVTEVTNSRTITTNANTNYIGILFNKSNISIDDFVETKIQLVEGTSKTYLPYNNIGVKVVGENLFDGIFEYGSISSDTGVFTPSTTNKTIIATKNFIPIQPNTSYVQKTSLLNKLSKTRFYDKDFKYIGYQLESGFFISYQRNTGVGVPPNNAYYYKFELDYNTNDEALSVMNGTNPVMFARGENSNIEYKPYQEQIYTIDLQDNFLAKIGDVKDELKIAKDGSVKLIKRIGKYQITGEENWVRSGNTSATHFVGALSGINLTNVMKALGVDGSKNYNTHFVAGDVSRETGFNWYNPSNNVWGAYALSVSNSIANDLTTFKTWLTQNKPVVYYVLAEPQEINLEPIRPINAIIPQTNITTLATIKGNMNVETMKLGSDEAVLQNEGNIYSNPKIDIVGSGIINISLNGSQMFQVDLSENDEIIIDTDALEAYNPNTNQLMNRDVIGDYDNFRLQPGNNTLKLGGDVQHASITNYKRWL